MKVSSILMHMGAKYAIRGDVDYSSGINLDDLDIEWISKKPTNKEFHEACKLFIENKRKLEIENSVHEEYPNMFEFMSAITGQVHQINLTLAKELQTTETNDFFKLRTKISNADKKHKK